MPETRTLTVLSPEEAGWELANIAFNVNELSQSYEQHLKGLVAGHHVLSQCEDFGLIEGRYALSQAFDKRIRELGEEHGIW